ncbi:hypothetical protein [Pseudodesulfovibrio nedwellii]|uniref:hypothetical protein n=1 Tax=Pseudodesulfovibrio nedwellii TaxID=2973072 RepID=UPI00248F540D|nr:hypothetical protein [Pseudodesulfovibrio nedwellii]
MLVLLDDWIEDLGHLTEAQFVAACTEHRRNNKFFPCVKDILDAHAAVVDREPKLRLLALSGSTELTDEQVKRNRQGCRKILEIIARSSRHKRVPAA